MSIPSGQAAASRCAKSGSAVIDSRVETQVVLHVATLLGAAGDADRPGTGDLGELTDERADRAARGRDDDGFAGLRLSDQGETRIGGEAGHPEDTEAGGDGSERGVELAQPRPVRCRMRAPTRRRKHDLALGVAGMIGRDHFGDALAGHHLADPDRLGVGLPVVHPAAHVGVEGEVERPHQDPARWRLRHRGLLQAEVGRLRGALRSGGKDDLADGGFAHCHDCFIPSIAVAKILETCTPSHSSITVVKIKRA